MAGAATLTAGAVVRSVAALPLQQRAAVARVVQTVTGPLPPDRLGVTLMHEHVLVDFIGAEQVSPNRYDPDQVVKTALPRLTEVRALGCETLVDCTPAFIGRDVRVLKRVSDASGVHILTNTGYYGAANDKFLPKHAFTESASQLAARWIHESEHGIDGTDIRPAFMKIGVDEAPLSDVDAKLVKAAAIALKATGLTIASHTTTGAAAMAELEILDRAGVPAHRFIWVHAHNEKDGRFHVRAAKAGAWVEFDGIAEDSIARHVDVVRAMKTESLLERVLLSHDAGWYHVGEPGGGEFRPYTTLFTRLLPALEQAGLTKDEIRSMLVDNPRRAITGDNEGL
jgi:phosphotriesterase-related protein